jgi:hypothetical protein
MAATVRTSKRGIIAERAAPNQLEAAFAKSQPMDDRAGLSPPLQNAFAGKSADAAIMDDRMKEAR